MKKSKGIITCCCIIFVLFLWFGEMKEVHAADEHCGVIKVMCGLHHRIKIQCSGYLSDKTYGLS
mgnify:CR=1 FL=1